MAISAQDSVVRCFNKFEYGVADRATPTQKERQDASFRRPAMERAGKRNNFTGLAAAHLRSAGDQDGHARRDDPCAKG
jgi:hypothetical protein